MKQGILVASLLISSLLSFRAAMGSQELDQSHAASDTTSTIAPARTEQFQPEQLQAATAEEAVTGKVLSRATGGARLRTRAVTGVRQAWYSGMYGKTIGKVDDFINRSYTSVGDTLHNHLDEPVVKEIANVTELAGLTAGAVFAYRNRAALLPHVTWANVANVAGGVYLANKLAPDWLKNIALRIPFVRRVTSSEKFTFKFINGASKSPRLACAEYAALGGIAYGLRNHISAPNVAKTALVAGIASLVTPQCIKRIALKVPVLRRLV